MINAEFIKFIIINWYTGRVDFATEVYLTCCFLKKQEKEQNNTNTSFHGSKMDLWKSTKTPCCFLNDFQRMIKSDRVQQSHIGCEYTWGLLVLTRGREFNQKLEKFFNFTEKKKQTVFVIAISLARTLLQLSYKDVKKFKKWWTWGYFSHTLS